jgi:hypothetical protein
MWRAFATLDEEEVEEKEDWVELEKLGAMLSHGACIGDHVQRRTGRACL